MDNFTFTSNNLILPLSHENRNFKDVTDFIAKNDKVGKM